MYRSTDDGASWTSAGFAGETIDALSVDPGSGAIYVTTRNHAAAFRTTDGGESWQPVAANLAWFGTVTDPNDSAVVYATTNEGIVKASTTARHGPPPTTASSRCWSPPSRSPPATPATLYAAADGSSVFKSSDRGLTWHAETAVLGGASISTLTVEPRRPRAIFAGTGRGLFKSDDAGGHWSRVQTLFPWNAVRAVAIDPQHPRTVYLADCGGVCGAGGFQRTDDGGASWRPITGIPWAVQSLAIDPQHHTIFAGTLRGDIYRSQDDAHSWQRVATAPDLPKSHQHAIVALSIDPRDPDNMYAARATSGIIKSSDGGTTWARTNAGLANLDMYALAIDPHNPQVLLASTYGGVFMTTDGAKSWQPYGRGLPAGGVAAFTFDPNGSTVYAATNGDGVDTLQIGS